MTILPVVINGQKLQKGNGFPEVVEKSKDWLSLEFEGLPTNAESASVYFELSWEYGKTYDALITNNSCVIPEYCTTLPKYKNEFVDYVVYVSVAAIVDGKRFTTDKLEIKIDQTAYKEETENTPELPESQYEQFVGETESYAKRAESAAKRAEDAANQAVEIVVPDNSVTTNKIVDRAVTGTKIANNAVTVAQISDMAVTTNKLDLEAVTNNRIAPLAISADKIRDKSVTAEKLSDDVKKAIEDAGNIDLSNYYTKPETDVAIIEGLKTALKKQIVDNLPEQGEENVLYLLKSFSETTLEKLPENEFSAPLMGDVGTEYYSVVWDYDPSKEYYTNNTQVSGSLGGFEIRIDENDKINGYSKIYLDVGFEQQTTVSGSIPAGATTDFSVYQKDVVYISYMYIDKKWEKIGGSTDDVLGDIDTALDAILAIQAELIGGDA